MTAQPTGQHPDEGLCDLLDMADALIPALREASSVE